MKRINIPDSNLHLAVPDDEAPRVRQVVATRHTIIVSECKSRGWDMGNLSFEQILELRRLPAWKAATS